VSGAQIQNGYTGKADNICSIDDFIAAMKFGRKWNEEAYERNKIDYRTGLAKEKK